MFPHEEFLLKALQESTISVLVRDLGAIYTSQVVKLGTTVDLQQALKIEQILNKASLEIAELGPKVRIPHPMDGFHVDQNYA